VIEAPVQQVPVAEVLEDGSLRLIGEIPRMELPEWVEFLPMHVPAGYGGLS
jgi:hypothetical protein